MNDSGLVHKIRRGDNATLQEIYRSCRSEFLNWAKATYNVDEETGVEVFQEAVVIMYDNVVTGKLEQFTSSVKTYLFGIARNKIRETRRRKEFPVASVSPEILGYLEEESEHKMAVEQDILTMYACLRTLGDPCKSILELFYFNALPMEDIALLMGYKNTDTAKSRKFKCLKRLRLHIQQMKGDE